MKILAICLALTYILLKCIIGSTGRNSSTTDSLYIKILRNTDFADDSLEVPSAKCISSLPYCAPYRAIRNANKCSCFCGRDKSTFYEPLWKCVDNKEIRERESCDMLFKDETAIDPLKVLSNEVNSRPLLIPFNTSALECKMTLDAKLNAAMDCNGNWKPLSFDYVQQAFSFKTEWTRKSIELKLSNVAKQISLVQGKLMKLAVQCRLQNTGTLLNTSCVLFKVKGTSRCCPPGSFCESGGSTTLQPTKTTVSKKTTVVGVTTAFTRPSTRSDSIEILVGTDRLRPLKPSRHRRKSRVRRSKPSRHRGKDRVLGSIFGVGVAAVIIITIIITLYLRAKKRRKKKRDALLTRIRVPRVCEGLNYDQPIIPHATDKSCFGNPTYQRGEDKSIVIRNGKIDTKSLLTRNFHQSTKTSADQACSNPQLLNAQVTEEIGNSELTKETTVNTEKPAEKGLQEDKLHQYEVIVQTSSNNSQKRNTGDEEKYAISPYCVTYFGKNARGKQINEDQNGIVTEEQTISNENTVASKK